MAFRVPTPDVSAVDLTILTEKDTSIEEIDALMKKASESYLKVFSNIRRRNSCPRISFITPVPRYTIPSQQCRTTSRGKRFFKVVSWYDNEWGYSHRVIDLLSSWQPRGRVVQNQ